MNIVAMTDVGNIRKINQDYASFCQKSESECLAVFCDGMGGHNAGEIASRLTCEDVIQAYQSHSLFQDEEEIRIWLNDVIIHANCLLQEMSQHQIELSGMGTTVVIALIVENQLYVSHIGDSRAYYYHDDLIQLTKDDTYVNALVESGTITKDEALVHPQKNILLQAVGVSDTLKVSFYHQQFDEGMVMLCSDGLYNSLFDNQIVDIIQQDKSLEDIGHQLIDTANLYGGNDNIGFILMRKEEGVDHE